MTFFVILFSNTYFRFRKILRRFNVLNTHVHKTLTEITFYRNDARMTPRAAVNTSAYSWIPEVFILTVTRNKKR